MISERQFLPADIRLRRWAFPLAFAIVMLILAAIGPPATGMLRFDRAAIGEGEWYRVLTGNFVHLDFGHALLNCAGLLLLPLLAEEVPTIWQWLLRISVLGTGVGVGLYLMEPDLDWYVGLSGVLHGLFVLALGRSALRGEPVAGQVLLLLMGKVGWEHFHGPLKLMGNAPVIVTAHSYGIISALIYALITWPVVYCLGRFPRTDHDTTEKD